LSYQPGVPGFVAEGSFSKEIPTVAARKPKAAAMRDARP
jgi:hypothetical protein